MVYIPYTQYPAEIFQVIVRTDVEPMTLSNALRKEVLDLTREQPISRLRTLLRSRRERDSTGCPLMRYSPSVGESRRPAIDNSVDFPQPDGPEMDTNSPL